VAEIEKQFTRLEAGVAALRRVQANLKRYRAAVLKAACEGKLVPTEAELARVGRVPPRGVRPNAKNAASGDEAYKDGPYETGEQLLQRILAERRQNWQGRGQYKEPAALDTTGLPPLPEGWTWAQFGYLGKDPFNTVQTGPFGAQLHNTEFTESGVPVIAVGNLTGTGFRTDGLYFVNAAKAKQLARYDVWAGDLLFARSGATLGKVCVAPDAVQDWRMTGHILRARLNHQLINPKVAVYALAALAAVRKQVFGNVRGVTRPGFNTGLLESILIPLPPLTEQTRIVAEVERRLSVVEELESVVSANLQRATRLRQSILQKAFTGELH
jgi:type I restriction enzyme S subunit